MRRCIISYAKNGREQYEKALLRGKQQAAKFTDVDLYFYSDLLPDGCPTHKEVPYAFKPYIFKKMFEEGYDQVIWIDSTIMVNQLLGKLWTYMDKHGVMAFHNLGHPLQNYISDKATDIMGVNDLQLSTIEQIMACVVGFDYSNIIGRTVFDDWYRLAQSGEAFKDSGSTRKGFKAHRHDQAVLSVLLWQYHVKLLPYGRLVYQPDDTNGKYDDIYFINKGI